MQSNQGWHTATWGIWGWLETILKVIAVGAGIVAFVNSGGGSTPPIGENPRLIALILLAVLTLGAVFQLFVRFGQKETISLSFAVLNLLGHLGLLAALVRAPEQTSMAVLFGVFYVLGQVVKIIFLRATGYTEGGATSGQMTRIAVAQAAAYAVFVLLMPL